MKNTIVTALLLWANLSISQELVDNKEISRSVGSVQNELVDLNNDGISDLVTLAVYDFAYYLSEGDGSFSPKILIRDTITIGNTVESLGFDHADFNQDGLIDFVLAANVSNGVEVYINNGNGFNTVTLPGLDSSRYALVCLDLSGDGVDDILTFHQYTNGVSVLRWSQLHISDGNGNFTSVPFNFTFVPGKTRTIDLDYDGDLDIVINQMGQSGFKFVHIYENLGTTFQTAGSYGITGGFFNDCDFIDVNQDGFLDLVVPFKNHNYEIHWWELHSFTSQSFLHVMPVPYHDDFQDIECADVDLDGNKEMLMTSQSVAIKCELNGTSLLSVDTIASLNNLNAKNIEVGIFNGDTFPDILLLSKSEAKVFMNDSLGNFLDGQRVLESPMANTLKLADLDNDGKIDLIGNITVYLSNVPNLSWYRSNGIGYDDKRMLNSTNLYVNSFELSDIDLDGDIDIIAGGSYLTTSGTSANNRLFMLINDGAANFSAPIEVGLSKGNNIVIVDLDGDGDMDIVACENIPFSSQSNVTVFWNNGFVFTSDVIFSGFTTIRNLFVKDYNMDGYKDIVFTKNNDSYICYNDGFQNFSSQALLGFAAYFMEVKDFTNDGVCDLLRSYNYGSYYEKIEIFVNDGFGNTSDTIVVSSVSPSNSSSPTIYSNDLNNDSLPDLISYEGGILVYYKNLGNGYFTIGDTIRNYYWPIEALVTHDLNGDGISELFYGDVSHPQIMLSTLATLAELPQFTYSSDSICYGDTVLIQVANYQELNDNLVWALFENNIDETPEMTDTNGVFYFVPDSIITYYIAGYGGVNALGPANSGFVYVQNDNRDTTILACYSYYWSESGLSYNQSGDYSVSYLSSNNCDSIVTLHLDIQHDTSTTQNTISCDQYLWNANNVEYFQTGTFSTTLTTNHGCDSSVTLNLIILESTAGDTASTSCDQFQWYDSFYYQSGDYIHVLSNQDNCDSVVTLHLTLNSSDTSYETTSACEYFIWSANNQTYTQSGTYRDTLQNQFGCDSVVVLYLTVNYNDSTISQVVECDSYTWNVNGGVYDSSGVYWDTLATTNGCDSLVFIDLTILNSTHNIQTIDTCDFYYWNESGQNYSQSGQYNVIYTNSSGCDSVIILDLTIRNSSSSTIIDTAMDVYVLNGFSYFQSGSYVQYLTNSEGCDSTIYLELFVQHTGLEEGVFSNFSIYPNPSNGSLVIERKSSKVQITRMAILDSRGKNVHELNPKNSSYDLTFLAAGIYYIHFQCDEQNFQYKWVRF